MRFAVSIACISLFVPALALAAPKPAPGKDKGKDQRKPAAASSAPRGRTANASPPASARQESAKSGAGAACMKPPVEVVALTDDERFPLARCDGSIAPQAVEHLSVMLRPGGTPKPKESYAALAKTRGDKLAPGIKRVDPGLVVRLQKVLEHFARPSSTAQSGAKIWIVSGYRPSSKGSKHADARAMDFRIDGVANEDLVAFCKTLDDTGCGYYPNSTFVHMDVRDHGAGHVSWIDASGPGESPRYVTTWPPPRETAPAATGDAKGTALDRLDRDAPPQERDDHPEKVDPDSLPALPMPVGEER